MVAIQHEPEPSIGSQHIVMVKGRPYVMYAGLLDLAHRSGLLDILTEVVQCPSDGNGWTAIMLCRVVFERGTFTGIGDANPDNTSAMVSAHYIRIAETRAKGRALRDALNIDMVTREELGESMPDDAEPRDAEPRDDERSRPPEDMARPVYRGRPEPVTTPQIALIKRLGAEAERAQRRAGPFNFSTMTKREASDHITRLQGGN